MEGETVFRDGSIHKGFISISGAPVFKKKVVWSLALWLPGRVVDSRVIRYSPHNSKQLTFSQDPLLSPEPTKTTSVGVWRGDDGRGVGEGGCYLGFFFFFFGELSVFDHTLRIFFFFFKHNLNQLYDVLRKIAAFFFSSSVPFFCVTYSRTSII